jgi:hypothetical protein
LAHQRHSRRASVSVARGTDGEETPSVEPEGSRAGASDEKGRRGRWGPETGAAVGAAEGSRRRDEGVDILYKNVKKDRKRKLGEKTQYEKSCVVARGKRKYKNLP